MPPSGGSADKASKVKHLLASYYDMDDGAEAVSLHDTPRWAWGVLLEPAWAWCGGCKHVVARPLIRCLLLHMPASFCPCPLPSSRSRRPSPVPSPAARALGPQLASASSSGNLDSAALNASYFDPDAYLKRMLKETRLAELTAKQRDMAAEVGGLDSDMQVGSGKLEAGRATRGPAQACWKARGKGRSCSRWQ